MSQPTQKRARACDACHSIKIKCELGSSGSSPPCERCVRLNKDCTVSAPKKQKDRVAELEAEVESLRRLLNAQSLSTLKPQQSDVKALQAEKTATSNESAGSRNSTIGASKKRRLEVEVPGTPRDVGKINPEAFRLGSVVSDQQQGRFLEIYKSKLVPTFPSVPVPQNWSMENLRVNRPFILEAIVYAICPADNVLSIDEQEDITEAFMKRVASSTIAEGDKSLEMLQALQIACLWYRTPRRHKSMAVFQLIQLAHGIAIDIGIGGPQSTPWIGLPDKVDEEEVEPADEWRAWLTCHLLSANMVSLLRRPSAHTWTSHHDICLNMLEYSSQALESDRLMSQYFRAERLCEQVVGELDYAQMSIVHDISDVTVQKKVQRLRGLLLDWQVQIPAHLHHQSVVFFRHVATLYINELVLHTTTNKQSFAAPFVAEHLSLTDFPSPSPTIEHLVAMNTLISSCHSLLDLFTGMDAASLVALPGLLFSSRIAYALFLLIKVYVATTAPGNTYGTVINSSDLEVDTYIDRIMALRTRVNEVDSQTGSARILFSATRMNEWLESYKKMLAETSSISMEFTSGPNPQLPTPGWDTMPDDQAWDLEALFGMEDVGNMDFDELLHDN